MIHMLYYYTIILLIYVTCNFAEIEVKNNKILFNSRDYI